HRDAVVRLQDDAHGVAEPCEGLVDRVVDDLVDQMVQATLAGGADVHAGPLTDRLETLENGDVGRLVARGAVLRRLGPALCSPVFSRTFRRPAVRQCIPPGLTT